GAVADLRDPHRHLDRDRVPDPAHVLFRSDDRHVADRLQRIAERRNSETVVPVVVGDEDLGAIGHGVVVCCPFSTPLTMCDRMNEMIAKISAAQKAEPKPSTAIPMCNCATIQNVTA